MSVCLSVCLCVCVPPPWGKRPQNWARGIKTGRPSLGVLGPHREEDYAGLRH